MPAHGTITIDTQGPQGVTAELEGGLAKTAARDVSLVAESVSGDVAWMKVWGDVDPAFHAGIQPLEGDSDWIAYDPDLPIRISVGEGVKTVNVKLQDDVLNPSSAASDTIELDTTIPTVNFNVPFAPAKISEQNGADVSVGEWSANQAFEEFEVRVVPDINSSRLAGALIGSTNGSDNVAGAAGGYPAATNIVTTINGSDLKAAAGTDGAKFVKVFVRDDAGSWSA